MKILSRLLLQKMSQLSSYRHEKYCCIHGQIFQYLISIHFRNYVFFFLKHLFPSHSSNPPRALFSIFVLIASVTNIPRRSFFLTPEVSWMQLQQISLCAEFSENYNHWNCLCFLGFSFKCTVIPGSLPLSSCGCFCGAFIFSKTSLSLRNAMDLNFCWEWKSMFIV